MSQRACVRPCTFLNLVGLVGRGGGGGGCPLAGAVLGCDAATDLTFVPQHALRASRTQQWQQQRRRRRRRPGMPYYKINSQW